MALMMPSVVAGTHVFRPTNSTVGISATFTLDTEPEGEESQGDVGGTAVAPELPEVEDGSENQGEDEDRGDLPHSQC